MLIFIYDFKSFAKDSFHLILKIEKHLRVFIKVTIQTDLEILRNLNYNYKDFYLMM